MLINFDYCNYYGVSIFIEFISLFTLLIYSYIQIRKVFIKDKFDLVFFNNQLYKIMNLSILISIFTLFFTSYTMEFYENGGSLFGHIVSFSNIFFNIFYLLNFEASSIYAFRVVSIIIYLACILLIIKGIRTKKIINATMSLLLGCLANFLIYLDIDFFPSQEASNIYSGISFIGIVSLIVSFGCIIYLNLQNKKEIRHH